MQMRAILGTGFCLASLLGAGSPKQATRIVQLLDNGDFLEEPASPDGKGMPRIPWWEIDGGFARVVDMRWLSLGPGQVARQRMAAYAPSAKDLVLRGRVRFRGRVVLIDGADGRAVLDVGASDGKASSFELRPASAVPPFTVELTALESTEWTDLEARVPLPATTREELREEIVSILTWIFDTWRERGGDVTGRKTAFVASQFDAVTGERLAPIHGGIFPLHVFLAEVLEVREVPEWRAALDAFLADYLDLGLHGTTGMPRRWDAAGDEPLDLVFVQIGMDLSFLLGIAERGPEAWRARARAAAAKIGETVLAKGVLPDGSVAAEYRPADGAISTNVPPLRRLDVPCQLARLGALLGDERYLRAARNAVADLEYTHFWSGTWSEIDPGFDDDFGHYGARAVEMLRAHPGEPAFRGLAESGWRHYAPLWRDSTRFGGTVAADQVRCWALLADFARLAPDFRDEIAMRVAGAARAHFKGEQYPGGAWGDVTFFGFDPKTGLEVGDLPGTPANLLNGLAIAHEESSGPVRDDLRAMYTAVLRSTMDTYRKPYGCLTTQRERRGSNPAGGELRLLPGLVRMLRQLR